MWISPNLLYLWYQIWHYFSKYLILVFTIYLNCRLTLKPRSNTQIVFSITLIGHDRGWSSISLIVNTSWVFSEVFTLNRQLRYTVNTNINVTNRDTDSFVLYVTDEKITRLIRYMLNIILDDDKMGINGTFFAFIVLFLKDYF